MILATNIKRIRIIISKIISKMITVKIIVSTIIIATSRNDKKNWNIIKNQNRIKLPANG